MDREDITAQVTIAMDKTGWVEMDFMNATGPASYFALLSPHCWGLRKVRQWEQLSRSTFVACDDSHSLPDVTV